MQESKKLIIVAGLPRSGTTWLEGILNSHPNIFLYHEIDDRDSRKGNFSQINYKINQENEGSYKQALLNGIEELQKISILDPYKKRKAQYVGFKTVGRFTHPTIFTWMRKVLNYPQTIFIIRHPAAYVASQLRFADAKTTRENVEKNFWYVESLNGKVSSDIKVEKFLALSWMLSNELILANNLNTQNFYCVVYEDLCHSPQSVTQNILNSLQLKMHRNVSKFLSNSTNPDRNFFTKLMSNRYYSTTKKPFESANKWINQLSEEQKFEIFSTVNDSYLMKYWRK